MWETKPHPYTCYVRKPVYETVNRDYCEVVRKPVHYTKKVMVNCGRWETQVTECPGPVVTKCVQEPGCRKWDPCCCKCVYCPGASKQVQIQCPPRKVCKKVWVPETKTREINCVKYVAETRTKTVPYTVCKMGPEARPKTCTDKIWHTVTDKHDTRIPHTLCMMWADPRKN